MAKTQFLKYFEDWLTKIKVRTEVYEKFEKKKVFISSQIYKGHKITVHTVIQLGYEASAYASFMYVKIHKKRTFANNIFLELDKIIYLSMTLVTRRS